MMNPTTGPAREIIDSADAKMLEDAGILVHDDRRLRSFFFDGRFLAAKDLTREQTYFLTRQADLCRSGGVGVIAGLRVMAGYKNGKPDGSLRIERGHGVTPSGEIVVIPHDLANVRLDDIPEIERLDAAFGLSPIPREAARNRSGLFVVALRPVEYTANPIASYPTTLGGARSVHDGDIIEAVAVTLVPFQDRAAGTYAERRSRAAQELFVRGMKQQAPVDALPIAMIALDHGVLQWVDEFLVRRELGSEQTDFLGFGYAPQALREAYLLQYKHQLNEVLRQRRQQHKSERFAASEHFHALPPVGPLPAAAIDPVEFTEVYFPPEVDVELTVVPDDELGALVEESLFLPPIDLTLSGEELASTSVLVIVPVTRRRMDAALASLFPAQRGQTVKLRSAAPGLVSKRLPGEALQALTLRWSTPVAPAPTKTLADAAWSQVLSNASTGTSGLLWYARRKNFPHKPAIIGVRVQEPDESENALTALLREAELYDEFSSLPTRATALAIGQTYELLSSLTTKKRLLVGAAGEILRLGSIEAAMVQAVKTRYSYTNSGTGIDKLIAAMPDQLEALFTLPVLAASLVVWELDRIGITLGSEASKLNDAAQIIAQAFVKSKSISAGIAEVKKKYNLSWS